MKKIDSSLLKVVTNTKYLVITYIILFILLYHMIDVTENIIENSSMVEDFYMTYLEAYDESLLIYTVIIVLHPLVFPLIIGISVLFIYFIRVTYHKSIGVRMINTLKLFLIYASSLFTTLLEERIFFSQDWLHGLTSSLVIISIQTLTLSIAILILFIIPIIQLLLIKLFSIFRGKKK